MSDTKRLAKKKGAYVMRHVCVPRILVDGSFVTLGGCLKSWPRPYITDPQLYPDLPGHFYNPAALGCQYEIGIECLYDPRCKAQAALMQSINTRASIIIDLDPYEYGLLDGENPNNERWQFTSYVVAYNVCPIESDCFRKGPIASAFRVAWQIIAYLKEPEVTP